MINVIKGTREFNEVEMYLMTLSPTIVSAKDLEDGTEIEVDGYLIFEDEKANGDKTEVMSIITPDLRVVSCQSATFKRSVQDIHSVMHGKPYSIIKTSGETKAGRAFINCELNISKL